jgi:hypothetical protein
MLSSGTGNVKIVAYKKNNSARQCPVLLVIGLLKISVLY